MHFIKIVMICFLLCLSSSISKEITIKFDNIPDQNGKHPQNYLLITDVSRQTKDTLFNGDLSSNKTVKFDFDFDKKLPLVTLSFKDNENQSSMFTTLELDTNFINVDFIANDIIIKGTKYYEDLSKSAVEYSKIINNKEDGISDSLFKIQIAEKIKKLTYNLFIKYPNKFVSFQILLGSSKYYSKEELQEVLDLVKEKKYRVYNTYYFNALEKIIESKNLCQIGKSFTNFSLKNDKEQTISLNDIDADFILIDFWASWCGPCIRKFPELETFYNKNKDKLKVITISTDQDNSAWQKMLHKLSNDYYKLIDNRQVNVNGMYDISAIPFSILLNKKKEIVSINQSFSIYDEIINKK